MPLAALWAIVGTIAAALIAAAGAQTVRLASVRAELEQERSARREDRAAAVVAAASMSQAYRQQEAAWLATQHEALRVNRRALDQARDDADGARVERGRLLDVARATAARRCEAAGQAGAAGAGAPAADPAVLLADVLGRVDARAGDLALYADQLRAAGDLCAEVAR